MGTFRIHPLTILAFGVGIAAIAAPSIQAVGPRPAALAQGIAQPDPTVPPAIASVLGQIRGNDRGQLAVSEEDGRFLRLLAATSRCRRALEIGGASGYSAIWLGLGLRESGGRLITIEYDPVRAREAAANVQRAGLSDIVQVIAGDAFVEIPKLAGTFDFVFLDAWKKDYARFFTLMLPRLDAGGLFLAHNVVNKRDEMPDFLAAIQRSPDLLTAIVTPSGEGISISYRRKTRSGAPAQLDSGGSIR
jgi:caffeoyl-CoA O-methyltransferase